MKNIKNNWKKIISYIVAFLLFGIWFCLGWRIIGANNPLQFMRYFSWIPAVIFLAGIKFVAPVFENRKEFPDISGMKTFAFAAVILWLQFVMEFLILSGVVKPWWL